MKIRQWLLAGLISMAVTTATAQETGDTKIGVGVTNFGVALQGEYTMRPGLNVRGMLMGGYSFDDQFEDSNYTVDGQVDLGGLALLADFYPFTNAWRISGGLFFSNTELTGDFIGPANFTGTAAVENDVAPIVTTGFRADIAGGVSVWGDLGVIISSLSVSSDLTNPTVQAEIDKLNSDLSDIPVVPYVGVGVSYRF